MYIIVLKFRFSLVDIIKEYNNVILIQFLIVLGSSCIIITYARASSKNK